MSLSGDKGVAQFKKSVKMGHPSQDPETIKIIENQHETQMDHIIKLRTSAESKFTMEVKKVVKF